MKNIFNAFFVIAILANLVLGIGLFLALEKSRHLEDLRKNDLTSIQQMNAALGLAKSELAIQKELADKYEKEIGAFPDELRKIIKEHKLKLSARDQTIARLSTMLSGGTTVVVEVPETATEPKKISYSWQDSNQRFTLEDPDIFTKDNERFSAKQLLQLKGWVFTDKTGKLQIKKVELSEVIAKGQAKDGSVVYEKAEGSDTQLVDSSFEYTDPEPPTIGLWDVIRPKIYASYDSSADPGLGVELLNFGKLVPFANLGLGVEINPDLSNVFEGSLSQTRLGANATYRFMEPLVDSNLGLGVGLSTPMDDLGGRWELTVDAIFYLTN